jgi:hypothetical protein
MAVFESKVEIAYADFLLLILFFLYFSFGVYFSFYLNIIVFPKDDFTKALLGT